MASIIAHTGSNYVDFVMWLRTPTIMILMILLVIALFYHAALGLEVVIDDYVHSWVKFGAVIAVRLVSSGLAVAGIVSILEIALAS